MGINLDDLICEIAEESGYRNWSPPGKGSYGSTTLKFIKLFDAYVANLLLRGGGTDIDKESLENIARVKIVVVKDHTIILPVDQPTGAKHPAEVIDMHDPDSVDRIRAWFKS
jgi:hypothetical protein